MFITKEDLKITIRQYEVDEITGGDDALVEAAISAAIGEIKPFLFRYDTERIFGAAGADRHPLLVRFAADIAVFELVSIARPDQDLENRRALYRRALDWLKQVKDEDLPVDFPKKEITLPAADVTVAYGSQPKRNNYF